MRLAFHWSQLSFLSWVGLVQGWVLPTARGSKNPPQRAGEVKSPLSGAFVRFMRAFVRFPRAFVRFPRVFVRFPKALAESFS